MTAIRNPIPRSRCHSVPPPVGPRDGAIVGDTPIVVIPPRPIRNPAAGSEGATRSAETDANAASWTVGLASTLVMGAALQGLMALLLPITGDERNAVAIGATLVRTGRAIETAPGTGVTSHSPAGVFVQAVFGASQLVHAGVASGRLLVFLLAVGASVLMALGLRRAVSARFAMWFTAAYWIAPWTVYHGALAWEPALIMALSAVAFLACLRLRDRPAMGASGLLAWSLVSAFQVHGQFMVMVISAAYMAWRKQVRVAALGAVIGLAIGCATLLPRPMHPFQGAVSAEYKDAHVGWGLTQGYPLLRAAGFWLRMGSSDLNRQLRENRLFLAPRAPGARPWPFIRVVALVALGLSFASVLVSLAASRRFLARSDPADEGAIISWLRWYALSMLAGLILASAASPVCIQGYHAVAALPAACLPMAAWFERTWSHGRLAGRWLVAALLGTRILVIAMVAVGHQL